MSFDIPILLIVFNRPDKTRNLFEIIKKVKPKKLYVSYDGPRANYPKDFIFCKEVKKIFEDINWDCQVKNKENEKNIGCKKNVVDSISWFFSEIDMGIILEDDCYPAKSFFKYCKILLEKYKNDQQIMQINGTNLGINYSKTNQHSYFASKLNHVWGWATWRRAWKNFDTNMTDYQILKEKGDFQNYYEDKKIYHWMLKYYENIICGKDNIWSTIWSFAILKKNGLCITPTKNLVRNIGFDGSGTSGKSEIFKKYSDTEIHEIDQLIHPENLIYDLSNDQLAFNEKIDKIDPRSSSINKIKIYIKNILNL